MGPVEAPHVPIAVLGSVGIQPPRKPNWYDQTADSTIPFWDGPICIFC